MNKKITQKITALLLSCVCCITLYAENKAIEDITGIYTGTLSIDLSAINGEPVGSLVSVTPDQISLEKETSDPQQIKLVLNNFALGSEVLGDIVVPNIPVTQSGETYNFESPVVQVSLMGGAIEADVKATGSINNNNTSITIDVDWIGISIPVNFTGDIISTGLRLSDIQINGVSVDGFDSDKFNYVTYISTGDEKISYTTASATVDVEMDGNWLYLYVTDGVNRNRYTLYALDGDESVTVIKKITVDQNIDGNVVLTNGAEIQGSATVAGTITYNKAIDATIWNTVGLPYDISAVNAVNGDNSKENIVDAYWYTYNTDSEQQKLNTPASAMIMKLKEDVSDVVSLDLVSQSGSTFERDDIRNIQDNTYHVIPNSTLRTIKVSDLFPSMNAYYTFDGTEFVQVDGSTEIAPATMFIVYKGSTPVSTISAPDPNLSGIKGNYDGTTQRVYSTEGQVYVENYNGIVEVYVLNGSKIYNQTVVGNTSFGMAKGTYIIRTGDKATMVNVR